MCAASLPGAGPQAHSAVTTHSRLLPEEPSRPQCRAVDPECSTPVRLSRADWNLWCRVLGRTKQRRNSRHLQGVPVSPGFLLSCTCSGHDTVGLGRNPPRTVSYADCRGLSADRGGALTRHSGNITEHPGQSICNSSPRSPEQGPPQDGPNQAETTSQRLVPTLHEIGCLPEQK